jgi:transcriptional regulator with XRE-family HTH domain
MITSAQLRAARGFLNWTVRDLAEKAGVHRNTVTRAETDGPERGHAVAQIARTLEAAGIEFTDGGQQGIRLKQESVAGLSQQIGHLSERITRDRPSGPASPARGMQQLRSAKNKNELVKLKNRRTRLKPPPREA